MAPIAAPPGVVCTAGQSSRTESKFRRTESSQFSGTAALRDLKNSRCGPTGAGQSQTLRIPHGSPE